MSSGPTRATPGKEAVAASQPAAHAFQDRPFAPPAGTADRKAGPPADPPPSPVRAQPPVFRIFPDPAPEPVLQAAPDENRTGLPDALKAGVERLSGISLSDVKVHYASSRPAQIQARAFAQGSEIHLAPGESKHLPHEAWHVVQQKQGRVAPGLRWRGEPVNADPGLEREAETMGAKARTLPSLSPGESAPVVRKAPSPEAGAPVQGVFVFSFLRGAIEGSSQPDSHYEGLGFERALSADGHWVWCDPRNADFVSQSFVSPQVVANYPPTAPPPQEEQDMPDELEAVDQLVQVVEELDHEADRIEEALVLPSAPLPSAAVPPPVPATRTVRMAVLQVPTHDKRWQRETSLGDRLALLKLAVEAATKAWAEEPQSLCVLTAPEYFFALQSDQSHFMDEREHERLLAAVGEIAAGLPDNVLFVPGTIGWSQRVGDLADREDSKEAQDSSSSSSASPAAAKLRELREGLNKRHEEIAAIADQYTVEELREEWALEDSQVESASPAEVRAVFNTAYVFFQRTMARYDKIVESTSASSRDRMSDRASLFMHGTRPFSNVYMNVRVSLEICSDHAAEVSRALAQDPALQIVTASYFGGGGGHVRGRHLLMADSTVPGSTDTQTQESAVSAVTNLAGGAKLIFSQRTLPTG